MDIGALLQQLLGAQAMTQGTPAGSTTNPDGTSDPTAGSGSSTGTNTSSSPIDLSSLIASDPGLANTISNVQGNLGNDQIIGGNQNQESTSGQTGVYSTATQQLAQSLGLSDQQAQSLLNTTSNTSGATQQQGVSNTATNTTTGSSGVSNTTSQGTTNTTPIDTLGFGQLLQSYAPQAAAATTASNNFLTNEMQQGNPALQQQIGQATSQALSGPGMVGTGNAAQGRAAGTAASQVGINDNALQLQAASQLAGPNALTTLSSAANPYIGSSAANTGTSTTGNTGTSNTAQNSSTLSNSSGLSNSNTTGSQTGSNETIGANLGSTLTSGNTSGTAAGSSSTIGQGQTPTSSSSGGTVICTVLASKGLIPKEDVELEHKYIQANWKHYKRAAQGYWWFGVPIAKACIKSDFLARLLRPIAASCIQSMKQTIQEEGNYSVTAALVAKVFYGVCLTASIFAPKVDKCQDETINTLAKTLNLEFQP